MNVQQLNSNRKGSNIIRAPSIIEIHLHLIEFERFLSTVTNRFNSNTFTIVLFALLFAVFFMFTQNHFITPDVCGRDVCIQTANRCVYFIFFVFIEIALHFVCFHRLDSFHFISTPSRSSYLPCKSLLFYKIALFSFFYSSYLFGALMDLYAIGLASPVA